MGRVSVEDAIQGVLARKGTHRVGRTKLMKCLYFLQQQRDLDVDLRFELYTWGPFDSTVLAKTEELKQGRFIEEVPPPADDRARGYDYRLLERPRSGVLDERQQDFLDKLLALRADELEAMSTLHFASKQLDSKDRELVVERVKNLKPYFRLADLRAYWDRLREWGCI